VLTLFQWELPHGRRFWLIGLVLAISGSLARGILPIDQPLRFAEHLLLYLGHSTLLLVPVWCVLFPILAAASHVYARFLVVRRTAYEALTGYSRASRHRVHDLADLAFVAVAAASLDKLGSEDIRLSGSIGLGLLGVLFAMGSDKPATKSTDILALSLDRKVGLTAHYTDDNGYSFPICGIGMRLWRRSRDLDEELARLLSCGWECVTVSHEGETQSAILRRPSDMGIQISASGAAMIEVRGFDRRENARGEALPYTSGKPPARKGFFEWARYLVHRLDEKFDARSDSKPVGPPPPPPPIVSERQP
jgi:hypothetical protein